MWCARGSVGNFIYGFLRATCCLLGSFTVNYVGGWCVGTKPCSLVMSDVELLSNRLLLGTHRFFGRVPVLMEHVVMFAHILFVFDVDLWRWSGCGRLESLCR